MRGVALADPPADSDCLCLGGRAVAAAGRHAVVIWG